jgi:hypothetical protein
LPTPSQFFPCEISGIQESPTSLHSIDESKVFQSPEQSYSSLKHCASRLNQMVDALSEDEMIFEESDDEQPGKLKSLSTFKIHALQQSVHFNILANVKQHRNKLVHGGLASPGKAQQVKRIKVI